MLAVGIYRWRIWKVYLSPHGWVGWAIRWPDRTTDYFATPGKARDAVRVLIDASRAEKRGEPWEGDTGE